MAGYQGATSYQGYDENSVKRQRAIADALTQRSLQDRGAPVQHWTQGVARLAEALMARQAGDRADKAETAFSDNRKKAADMLINAVAPGDASMAAYGQYEPSMMDKATALASGSMPARDGFNGFTPEQQAAGERNARLRALTSYMGDPMAAISADKVMNPGPDYQLFQDDNGGITRVDKLGGAVQQLKPGTPKPKAPIEVDGTLVDPETFKPLYTAPPKATQPDYVETQIGSDVYFVNKNNPSDRIKLGPAPAKAGSNGLTDNQALQFQFKLDDLDRELADKEKKRRTDLSTVSQSLGLLDDFLDPKNTERFNAVYGNLINPTGEGDDLFNWKVSAATDPDRANGMAILEQLGGRAFLDSIGAMKGTGALSDREGARVMAAAQRLTQANQSDDAARKAGEEFRAALVSYKSALEQDIQANRMAEAQRRQQLQQMMGQPGTGGAPAEDPRAAAARNAAGASAEGNPWPTIRANAQPRYKVGDIAQLAAPEMPNSITAPNGKQFSRDEAVAVRNFMATLPPQLQDDNFMAQLDAALSEPAPNEAPAPAVAAPPSIQDLVNKHKTKQ